MDVRQAGERWMSYAELAKSRGITKASATRLAFKKGWARRVGNDGLAKVAVPKREELPPAEPDAPDAIPVVPHGAMGGELGQGPVIEALRAELAKEREHRARAEGEVAGLQAALAGFTPALEAAHRETEVAQREAQTAREDARSAYETAQTAREEAAYLRGQVDAGERSQAGQATAGGGAGGGRALGVLRRLLGRLG